MKPAEARTTALKKKLRTTLEATLDLLLPAVCPGCLVAAGPKLCISCVYALATLSDPCPWCSAPQRSLEERCAHCQGAGIPHIHRIIVSHVYCGEVQRLIGLAKTVGRPAAVRALSELVPPLPHDAPAGGVVVPVPPSPGRRPGPHLGSTLALSCARRQHLPFRRLLITTRLGAEQHLLSPRERRANVVDLFQCIAPAPAYVVLVDDLITTGATASAAAAALRAAGAKRVDVLCLARTPRHGEFSVHTNQKTSGQSAVFDQRSR